MDSNRGTKLAIAVGALVLLVIVSVVVLSGGDDDGDGGGETADLPGGCGTVEAPAPKDVQAEPPAEDLQGPVSAVVATSCGDFTIELDTANSPKTASSFASLAEQGFYDETSIHRIEQDFVVQGGDPLGTGEGGPGYSVDEPPADDTVYSAGTVAMAKTAAEPPGRSGSQFFVVVAPADAGLPPDYAVLGEVTEGFESVEAIEALGDPAATDGTPIAPVVIESVTIRRG